MSEYINYIEEDTGALMTGAKGKDRAVRVVLIVIAIILVAAISLIGAKKIGDKRYNDQIEIADKAFIEGDYVTAEAEYLKAVEMNKRKPKARESLAYTYAVQSKTEESAKIYEELFVDTKDEKYQKAAQDVAEGRLPADNTLIPAVGAWRNIKIGEIPFSDQAINLLFNFYVDCALINDCDGFDSKNPNDFPALSIFMTGSGGYGRAVNVEASNTVFDEEAETATWMDGTDPRKWSKDGYYMYSEKTTNQMLKEVFNISDITISNSLSQGEKERQIYQNDDHYYCVYGWVEGIPGYGYGIEIENAWSDGEKYCIKCNIGQKNDDGEYEEVLGIDKSMDYTTYFSVLQLKSYKGNYYWSFHYFGTEEPKEVSDLETKNNNAQNIGTSEKYYKPVIDEYKEMLKMYNEGFDFSEYGYDNNPFEYVYYQIIPSEINNQETTPEYSILDINGDGVSELIIGGSGVIGSMFTLDMSNRPALLKNCDSYMYRAKIDIYEDGTIEESGSSGAALHSWTFYEIDGQKTELVEVSGFVSDLDMIMQDSPYMCNGKTMTEDEFNIEIERKESLPKKKLTWKNF